MIVLAWMLARALTPIRSFLCRITGTATFCQKKRMKLLIDTDSGIDDAEAILMALAQPDVEVVGITCVHGNTNVHQVTKNVLRTLQAADRLDIPVFRGAEASLIGEKVHASAYHGDDGLGDAPDPNAPLESLAKSEHAVQALIRYANEMKGELTLIAIGPLTNLALAIRLDQNFTSNLKHIMIMGGNIEGRGNGESLSAEFNFQGDPEGALAVFNDIKCPASIVTWEVCCQPYNNPSVDKFLEMVNMPTKKAHFVKRIRQKQIDEERFQRLGFFRSCDALAMAALLRPDIVEKSEKHYATVELNGSWTRGQMVVDWEGLLKKEPNLNIIMRVNKNAFVELFESALR
ncbi:nucleoside hydrolase-like isoform X1 [Ptychodera flava]|uniref:nucleoside hydrolase-like isoform X1 n=1 Tax=Ptychodera flava TaxID=63121 RepID=UPI00396A7748